MRYAVTIFFSAFLLFQVQPLIARYILPWFGGSPAVWSTSMLFFQVGLLLGYSYSHLLVTKFELRKQVLIHIILLAVSLIALPITPGDWLKPEPGSNPVWGIIKLLTFSVGFPYVMVSSTGPLLQHWFGQENPEKSPYRLYSLSNLGSLLGLLTYPFLFEPAFTLRVQTLGWSVGYGVFVLLCGWAGYVLQKRLRAHEVQVDLKPAAPLVRTRLGWADPLLWIALSACGSVMLLAATNFICQDVAVIPFLWVLPLSLYLITFIIAFDNPRWYNRYVWIPLLAVFLGIVFYLMREHYDLEHPNLWFQLAGYCGAMFVAVMVCHGEMVRLKPAPDHLTAFYLLVSVGGALGGLLVNFLVPRIFNEWWEFPLAFMLITFLAGIAIFRTLKKPYNKLALGLGGLVWLGGLLVMSAYFVIFLTWFNEGVVTSTRNFYGVLRVIESDDANENHRLKLFHGSINHGFQYQVDSLKQIPTSYYPPYSGIGLAFNHHPLPTKIRSGKRVRGLKVGMIGLGVGTIATYGLAGDKITFYEINPAVQTLAEKYFTYLSASAANCDVVLGDARVVLEQELKTTGSREFDILAVDAFSGDAIPVHLLTREAFNLYFQHLKSDGILTIHISNRYFNLRPLLYSMGQELRIPTLLIETNEDFQAGAKQSTWVIMTQNQKFLNNWQVKDMSFPWEGMPDQPVIWTDDYTNVLKLLQ
ncbi:MAG: fused MFS/spermidine synthase [Bacteroidia bacterium]|nr:fused MFS/spermidine synthase [Bacteroidia bacterium]